MIEKIFDDSKTLHVHGYCHEDPMTILNCINNGSDVGALSGDFVLYNNSLKDGFAISSFLSALPFYYAISKAGELVQGDNVFDVAKRSGKKWKWNDRTLRSLALYGHSINSDTLCEGVYRLPPASKISKETGQWVVEPLPVSPILWDQEATQEQALFDLTSAFDKLISQVSTVHLSLSAGYDSRLLLALCLDRGITPSISVMGGDDSTDVVIATALCKNLGLPIEIIRLDPQDYLRLGRTIAYTTSGVKTAMNWHTYLYGTGKDFSKGIHLVGSNGEFARSFFFDKPRFDPFAKNAPSRTLNAYWLARCTRRALKFSSFNPLLKQNRLCLFGMARAASVGKHWSVQRFLPALDAFYAEQRVRHFIGAGLACYAHHGSPRSPFLDATWMRRVAAMPRHLKQRNSFHSASTKALRHELGGFKYNRLPDSTTGPTYSPFALLAKNSQVTELLLESSYLSQWATRNERQAIFSDPRCDQVEERNFWLTLHFAAQAQAEFANS